MLLRFLNQHKRQVFQLYWCREKRLVYDKKIFPEFCHIA